MMPPKGSTDHLDLSTRATSRGARSRVALDGSGTGLLERRATSVARPGSLSKISYGMFTFCSKAATYLAAAISLPLEVSMRTRSWSQTMASSEILLMSVEGGATCVVDEGAG